MINFLKKNIALLWAKKHVRKAEEFKKNAEQNQEKLLLSLVDTAKKTLFGREHDFENIRSVKDFQDKVKISDYEDLKPYIERVKKRTGKHPLDRCSGIFCKNFRNNFRLKVYSYFQGRNAISGESCPKRSFSLHC
ncbi:hypothetical protein QF024_001273 [Chryseobacterium nepalense]|nr:hypothetical protein [Chryseobacterium nepalense]